MKLKLQSDCRSRGIIALFGVVLLLALGLTQAAHIHADSGDSGDSHCSLCAVAHAPAAVPAEVAIPVPAAIELPVILFKPSLRSVEAHSCLYSRPPPVA
jgi:hypothetical protein